MPTFFLRFSNLNVIIVMLKKCIGMGIGMGLECLIYIQGAKISL